jgi:L-lactate dehydrogenase complex protein LldG
VSKARADIFRNVRRTAGRSEHSDEDAIPVIEKRLSLHARGPIPVLGESPLLRFIAKLEKVSATVTSIHSIHDLPNAVSEYLVQWNIKNRIVAASTPLLQNIQWQQGMTITHGCAHADDVTSLSVAYAGIAETGTLVVCSSHDTPTTLNFLPDNYICVIKQADIYPCMEDIWDLIRKQGQGMPRAINFITGPSRTADVEQTIQLGAHGPRRLHVIIYASD